MQKVKVDRYDPDGLEKALRKFKKIDREVREDMSRHEYYLRPGLRKALKSKLAEKRRRMYEAKRNKRQAYKNI